MPSSALLSPVDKTRLAHEVVKLTTVLYSPLRQVSSNKAFLIRGGRGKREFETRLKYWLNHVTENHRALSTDLLRKSQMAPTSFRFYYVVEIQRHINLLVWSPQSIALQQCVGSARFEWRLCLFVINCYRNQTYKDYEQSLCFLIVRRERSEKNRPRESLPHVSCCLGERRKKRDYRQSLSIWPLTAEWFYGVHFKSN